MISAGIRAGTSVKLDYMTVTVDAVRDALLDVLENPKYVKNAEKRSKLFRDQIDKPIDRALFWIEWVLRHKDNHDAIQLPINQLGVIVANSYDVIGVLVLGLLIVSWLLVKILKICVKLCCKREEIVQNKEKIQ